MQQASDKHEAAFWGNQSALIFELAHAWLKAIVKCGVDVRWVGYDLKFRKQPSK
jgi:hypothetical protein